MKLQHCVCRERLAGVSVSSKSIASLTISASIIHLLVPGTLLVATTAAVIVVLVGTTTCATENEGHIIMLDTSIRSVFDMGFLGLGIGPVLARAFVAAIRSRQRREILSHQIELHGFHPDISIQLTTNTHAPKCHQTNIETVGIGSVYPFRSHAAQFA